MRSHQLKSCFLKKHNLIQIKGISTGIRKHLIREGKKGGEWGGGLKQQAPEK